MLTYEEHNIRLEERIKFYRGRSQENYAATGDLILQQTKKARGEIKGLAVVIKMSDKDFVKRVKGKMEIDGKKNPGTSVYTVKEILRRLGCEVGVYYKLHGFTGRTLHRVYRY